MNARDDRGDLPPTGEDPGGSGEPLCLDEELLREALHREAFELRPGVWPEQRILERVRRRRVRRVGTAVPVVAAAAVAAVLLIGRSGATHVAPAPPAASPTATAGAPSPAPPTPGTGPAVRVVRPGQVVSLGHGQRMILHPGQRCLNDGQGPHPPWTCKSVMDGNQAQDSVGLQMEGGASGALYTPLYIGHGRAARMTVEVRGRTLPLQVVTLPGHPGYATGWAWGPPPKSVFDNEVSVEVYDAAGKLLARFAPPRCTMSWSPDPRGGRDGTCVPLGR